VLLVSGIARRARAPKKLLGEFDSPDSVHADLCARGHVRGDPARGTIEKWRPKIEEFCSSATRTPGPGATTRSSNKSNASPARFVATTTTKGTSCCRSQPTRPREPPAIGSTPPRMKTAVHQLVGPHYSGPELQPTRNSWAIPRSIRTNFYNSKCGINEAFKA
jgi:hypothetical protein